ncbi:NAD-dependent DNA ligase LigA [Limnohabitans sp. 2KL-1]|uniref:NAD-dependent DNA ligase LigA n=1 Tax=Limnohabitans sp. 2KL-1 TaxID=1100699 RepID=UPI000D3BE0BF|nr:NAD-dependent DNA ligase LigA [Limnohabitans sp. 2KL-1]PUE48955.1 NAD-dependent DNA ligase LigA [Limnohabitans sp. 2KL-1]
MSRITELRNLIIKAKHAYYYSGEPMMDDAEYDALEDELRQHSPDDPVLKIVGAQVPAESMLTKARHSIPMGSQSKVNSENEFRTWCQRNDVGPIHASVKGDGASAAAYYSNGRLVQAISRGDGVLGEDITANALRFKGLPVWVESEGRPFNGAVRFEVILTVEDWTRIDPSRSKNPRNAGTGIMGRKNGLQSDFLTIFAFDLDESRDGTPYNFATESEKTARLAELGFSVMPHTHCSDADEAVQYFKTIAQTRNELPIWIDGVVMKINAIEKQVELGVTGGRPKGQIAWKFDSAGAETVLEGVVVSGGHTGGLYPTAQLRAVDIGGTTITNASLANYDEIARLDVAIGDSVWVVKANDIIPKIIRVTERPAHRRAILQPACCPFCGGEVGRRINVAGNDGVIIECRNLNCEKKSTGKIRRWIASLDILGVGDVVLEAMVEKLDLTDAADLYTLRERGDELADLLINVDRDLKLGAKRATSILDAIEATRELSLSQFLGSLGLDHLGKRRVEIMISAADGALDELTAWRSGLLRDASFAAGVGVPSIGAEIQDGIDSMSQVIDKLLDAGVSITTGSAHGTAEQPELTVCISGKLHSGRKKSDYQEPLLAIGYALVDEVSKGLNFLVLADADSGSSKAEKARKLGVQVISEAQLIEMVGNFTSQESVSKFELPIQTSIVSKPQKENAMSKATTPLSVDASARRFEFVDDKSAKFWEVDVIAESVEVKFGKIGINGQAQIKEFETTDAARKHAEKLVHEKLKNGYQEVVQGAYQKVSQAPAKPVPAPVKPVSVKAKSSPAPEKSAPSSKKVCISGKLPSGNKKADYEAPLLAAGYSLVDDVVHDLAYLVLADPAPMSSKAEKARKLGVAVISEEDLQVLLHTNP